MTVSAIDSHVHIWDRTRNETFIAEKAFPVLANKAFLPADLSGVLAATNAVKAVLVHGPATFEHSQYCLQLCNRHDLFLSVIGWVDVRSGHALDQLDQLAADPNLRGIRLTPMLDANPVEFLTNPATVRLAQELAKRDLILEVFASFELQCHVLRLSQMVPEVSLVVAHFGVPTGTDTGFDDWAKSMTDLSKHPQIFVKVSGLPLSGDWDHDLAMGRRHFDHIASKFPANRLLYASNWPVASALAPPQYWTKLLHHMMQATGMADRDVARLMRETAVDLYSPRLLPGVSDPQPRL